jgi:hypothetical protein
MQRTTMLLLLLLTFMLSACSHSLPTPTAATTPAATAPPVAKEAPQLRVEVADIERSDALIAALKAKGYATALGIKNMRVVDPENNRVLWIGKNVPLPMLRDVVTETLRIYPLMNFAHVVGDRGEVPPEYVNYQVYVGGSIEAALPMKLKLITPEELLKELNSATSIEEVHRFLHEWNKVVEKPAP